MKFLVLAITALLLAGCGDTKLLRPQPLPSQLSTPEAVQQVTAVKVSSECRRFTKQVQHPAKPGDDAHVALKVTDHALSVANGRLKKADECIQQEVNAYATGLK